MKPIQKINIKISSLFFCVLFLFACNKDDLNLAPQTQISESQFFNTVSDLQVFCNSFYQQLPYFIGGNATSFSNDVPGIGSNSGVANIGIYGVDDNSDNMITGSYSPFLNGQSTLPPSGAGWATSNWTNIRNTNYFLANYQRVKDLRVNVSPYVGEAYFFKAWFYFDKLRIFGAVPWLSTPTTISDTAQLYSSRLARNVIADSINSCLDSAIANLPLKSRVLANRVYKEYAQAFRARVCLYEGTWEKYHQNDNFGVTGNNGNKYLQMAADTAQAIINSNVFALDSATGTSQTAYFNLFNRSDYSTSKEVMFWRKYDGSQAIYNFWSGYIAAGANRGITKNLVDAYLCTDGKPIGASSLYKGDDSLSWVVTNRDPRLKQTIYTPGAVQFTNNPGLVLYTIPPFTTSGNSFCPSGYQLYKGHSLDYAQANVGAPGSTTGLIFMRYAEVLLILAEAKAELGTLTQADVNATINKLRTRAGMPAAAALNLAAITPDPKWDFPTLSPIINEVRRERRVELACEGYRFDDIMRWAAAGTYFLNWKPKGAKWNQWNTLFAASINTKFKRDANGYIEPFQTTLAGGYNFNINRDYLEPIPQDQLLIAGYNQNPGW